MGGESAKGLLDRGQHGWLLPNPCRGHLGADKQAQGDSCAHKIGSGMTITFRLVLKVRAAERTHRPRIHWLGGVPRYEPPWPVMRE